MTTELIMEDELGFHNAASLRQLAARRAANRGVASAQAMARPGSRMAAMMALRGKGGTRGAMMPMKSALRFMRKQRGRPIPRSRAGVPGAMNRLDQRRAYGKRKKLARVAKTVIKKTRGRSPEMRARRAVFLLVHLFTGKGAKSLNTQARQSIRAIADTASKRAAKNNFPALTMKEIESLYKVSTR